MKTYFAAFLSVALSVSASAHADPGKGQLNVCRMPGIVSAADHKTISIQAGSHFAQIVPVPGHVLKSERDMTGDEKIGAIAKTVKVAQIGPKDACVVVDAALEAPAPARSPITSSTIFSAQFSDDNGAEFKVRVASGFK
jgi:hypothetical protein